MRTLTAKLKKLALLTSAALLCGSLSGAYAASDVEATLRLQTFGGGAQLESANNAIARFNKDYPNVKVEVAIDPISNGWGEFVTKVYSQFNAGNSFDVYHTATETFHSFASRGLMIPLDEYYPSLNDKEDFDTRLIELSKYKDKLFYIPSTWNNIMMNYNRTLFDEAGVEYPKPDWTWDDFRKAAQALTKRDESGNIIQFGYEVPGQVFFVMPWFFSNGTSIVNDDWTESNMLDPKVAETLQFLYDLVHKYKVSPVPAKAGMDNQFFASQVAIVGRGHWIITNAIASGINMDVAPVPAKELSSTVIGFGAYGISRDAKNKELAWELLQELVGKEHQTEEMLLGGAIPGRKSIAETKEFLEFPPSANLYYPTLPTSKAVPSPANFQEVEKIFWRNYSAMMTGEVSIEEGVKRTHKELTRSFERMKRILKN